MDEVEKEGEGWIVAKLFGEKFIILTELLDGEISQVWVSLLLLATLKQNNEKLNKTTRSQTFSWGIILGRGAQALLSERASRCQLIHLTRVLEKQALVLSPAVLSNRAIKQSRSPVTAAEWDNPAI